MRYINPCFTYLLTLAVLSTKHRHQSVDDSKPRQLLHSGRGYWISGPAG